ncbi:MAG: hypothetical protein A2Z20_04895 [Bdellovibrionales bacterium RBG_16_40_8]|nr:MAG: hypothetical protein A2Z20_04895 [Bdellovibrionales bacterium RBG_16_40_8]
MTTLGLQLTNKSEWIEMFPFGVAMGVNNVRPVMIFKDKAGKRVLPVWLSHMDAGLAVVQANSIYVRGTRSEGMPHEISFQILETLGIEIEKCLFKAVKGNHQYVDLHFKSKKEEKKLPKGLNKLEARADDAISFCMRSGCRFYATVDYIERSRVLEGEIVGMQVSRAEGANPHPYIN